MKVTSMEVPLTFALIALRTRYLQIFVTIPGVPASIVTSCF
jgi:hypothetical protein